MTLRRWLKRIFSLCCCEIDIVWGVGYVISDSHCPRHGDLIELPEARTVRR